MGAKAISAEDPGAVAFFVSNLCSEADLVYRFCYTVLLNEESAKSVVKEVYRVVAGQISQFLDLEGHDIRFKLLTIAWEQVSDTALGVAAGSLPVFPQLKALSTECRSVLVTVDVLGMSVKEAEKIFRMKHNEICRYLAEGRKTLLAANS
jgi:hypothetical protein